MTYCCRIFAYSAYWKLVTYFCRIFAYSAILLQYLCICCNTFAHLCIFSSIFLHKCPFSAIEVSVHIFFFLYFYKFSQVFFSYFVLCMLSFNFKFYWFLRYHSFTMPNFHSKIQKKLLLILLISNKGYFFLNKNLGIQIRDWRGTYDNFLLMGKTKSRLNF